MIDLDKLYQFLAKYNSAMGNENTQHLFAASDLTRSLISMASMDFSDLEKKDAPVKNIKPDGSQIGVNLKSLPIETDQIPSIFFLSK